MLPTLDHVKLNVAYVSRHAKPRLIFPRPRVGSWDSQYAVEEQIWFKDLPFNSWSGKKTYCPRDNRGHRPMEHSFPSNWMSVLTQLSSSTNLWLLATKRQYKQDYKTEPGFESSEVDTEPFPTSLEVQTTHRRPNRAGGLIIASSRCEAFVLWVLYNSFLSHESL